MIDHLDFISQYCECGDDYICDYCIGQEIVDVEVSHGDYLIATQDELEGGLS